MPILFLTVALILIRSQPYDDYELRQILSSDKCQVPCFMGIQPGITTINEAREILEASGWAKNIVLSSGINQTANATFISVSWEWNSNRSPLLDGTYPAYALSYAQDVNAVVNEIYVVTTIPTGMINLSFESPKRYYFNMTIHNPHVNAMHPLYIEVGYDVIQARTHLRCPLNVRDLWKLPTRLYFYSQAPSDSQNSREWDTRGIIQTLKTLCG